ncbi:MAG: hypothetical protein A2284_09620 [Deltaproteobacteria bacterium RIFOXYA12_FULL_61_11]|nr:MAG: hypothetical protein A2284_09620 [Deltaproteobacteria bacterium RIFOXYA12_FULL_61_11]
MEVLRAKTIPILLAFLGLLALAQGSGPSCLGGEGAAPPPFHPGTKPSGYDPEGRGPHAVGVRHYAFEDAERWQVWGLRPRQLPTTVWYPAVAGSGRTNTLGDLIGELPGWGDKAIDLVYGAEASTLLAKETTARIDAAPLSRSEPWPVIIFSHGNTAVRFQNYTLCEHLASHGFIVASADHYDNAIFVADADQATLFNPVTNLTTLLQRPRDIEFLYEQLHQLDSGELPDLELSAIGLTGHSYGGVTSLLAGVRYEFVAAIAPIDPVRVTELPSSFAKPYLLIQSAEDTICKLVGNSNVRVLEDFEACAAPLKVWLNLFRAGHYTPTDACSLLPPSLTGVVPDCGPDLLPPATANLMIDAYLTAFFQAVLTDNTAAIDFLRSNHYPVYLDHAFRDR